MALWDGAGRELLGSGRLQSDGGGREEEQGAPMVFYVAERDIRCVVQGDDFTLLG